MKKNDTSIEAIIAVVSAIVIINNVSQIINLLDTLEPIGKVILFSGIGMLAYLILLYARDKMSL